MRTLLKVFYDRLYHQLAWGYDFVAAVASAGRWQRWGQAALPYLHGSRILEIGFGPGHLLVALSRLGVQPFGLDASTQMVSMARANLRRNNFSANLLRGYAQSLPIASAQIDSILATFPSEYISEQPALAELWRVLKPAGRVVIVPTAWPTGKTLAERISTGLFRITQHTARTSENMESRLLRIFGSSGFHARSNYVEIEHSKVMIIIAEKPPGC